MQVQHYLRNQHGLVLAILQHVLVSIVTDGEDMGRHFISSLSSVGKHDGIRVNWKAAIGIDGHTEKPRVSLKIIIK